MSEIKLKRKDACIKRAFDVAFAFTGLAFFWWMILLTWLLASIDTKSNGFFFQRRVGLSGNMFSVIKIKTMRPIKDLDSTVTTKDDPRITRLGRVLRMTKVDELPQLINVLLGQMSFVGPRPDVPGYADRLNGVDLAILNVRPGITGPATLKYKNEEELLSKVDDPENYNQRVIWPDKVAINLAYIREWSLTKDIYYIYKTVVS